MTQEKCGLRRLPVAQDAVQQDLRLLGAIVFQQGHAQRVDQRVIVGIFLLQRREHFHRLVRLVGFEQAIGQQQSRFQFQWLHFVKGFQMRHGLRQPSQLVVCQRQVHPHLGIVRQLAQGQVVFRDGGGELSVPRQRGAQIRTDFGCVGIVLEELAVEPDGSGQIAGLVAPRWLRANDSAGPSAQSAASPNGTDRTSAASLT